MLDFTPASRLFTTCGSFVKNAPNFGSVSYIFGLNVDAQPSVRYTLAQVIAG